MAQRTATVRQVIVVVHLICTRRHLQKRVATIMVVHIQLLHQSLTLPLSQL